MMQRLRARRGAITGAGLALALLFLLAGAPALLAGQAQAATKSGPAQAIDINSASVEQLTAIPGIGPSLAQRIVDFREKEGPFRRVEDLLKVRGIGERSLEKIRPHVKVGRVG